MSKQPTPSQSPNQKPKPIPAAIWLTTGLLAVAAILCFVVALLLAPQWPPKSTIAPTQSGELTAPPLTDPPAAAEEIGPQAPEELPAITEYEVVEPLSPTTTPALPKTAQPKAAPVKKVGHLAIVLDDMGQAPEHTRRAIDNLPAGVTFSFLPYPSDTPALAQIAADDGHTIMVHIPMQPLNHLSPSGEELDSGPDTLSVTDTPEELAKKLNRNLAPLRGLAVGANNHMGSQFTGEANPQGMQQVLETLNTKGLFFLDSVTIAKTATQAAAKGISLTIPLYRRDVFLDHNPTEEAVRKQMEIAIKKAQQHPQQLVIAIGHPHPATLGVLEDMLPTLTSDTGVTLVPLNGQSPQ